MRVPLFASSLAPHREAIARRLQDVAASGRYILGPEVEGFERELAAYLGVRHCVGVANGTDALTIALRALGADADAGSLARAAEIRGRLMIIFGSQDPHVPAAARIEIISALYAAGLEDLELHVYAGGEHAFMRDVGARHDPVLTDLALAEAVSFLGGR